MATAPNGDAAPERKAAHERPLAGVTVLDFSQYLAGPACALRLADLGADVIKIERPDGGDACRQLRLADQTLDGSSVLFHTINRNKRSFAADLKSPEDRERVRKLIARADVLIHNFRPGVMDKFGFDYETLAEAHPKLIYASVSGYGTRGPWRDRPGQDLLVQALSGMTWLSGGLNHGPVPLGVSIADISAGADLCQGILAMLVRRATSGRGGLVEISLLEAALDLQFEQFTAFLNGPGAQPKRGASNSANIYVPAPYGIYPTSDGYLALAMVAPPRLGELIGVDELASYTQPKDWFVERDAIAAIIADRLKTNTASHWLGLLEPHGVWAARVLDWPQLIREEGYEALGATQKIEVAGGELTTTRCPLRIDGEILLSGRAAPRLGADTDDIANEFGL